MSFNKYVSKNGNKYSLPEGVGLADLKAAKLLFMRKLADIKSTGDELFLGFVSHLTSQSHYRIGRGGNRQDLADFLAELHLTGHQGWSKAYADWCKQCLGLQLVFEDRGTKEEPDVHITWKKTDQEQDKILANLPGHMEEALDKGVLCNDKKWLKVKPPKAKKESKKDDPDTSTEESAAPAEQKMVQEAMAQVFDADAKKAAEAAPILAELASLAVSCKDFGQYMAMIKMARDEVVNINASSVIEKAVNDGEVDGAKEAV